VKASAETKLFLSTSEKVGFDKTHRKKINFNISKYDTAVAEGKKLYANLDLARERAGYLKYKVVNDLDKYLIEFEDNFLKNGGKIIWARNAEEAVLEITKIIERKNSKLVVKSKSMTTEEIELNEALGKKEVEVVETDLGEFIVQQAGQKPYHIVTPAMHLSKEDVAALYHGKFQTEENLTPEDLTLYTRKILREKFIHADVGITGANFLIADLGGIALTENEGNAFLSVSFPKTHIAIAGIEKIIPSVKDIDLFWPLLATHGTGQHMTVYNSILTGPKKNDEKDGPEEMYLVLLDNGRSNLLAKERQRQALTCIRCGACLNVCPVYKTIGGHTYNTTYSGPIGAVITPYLKDFKTYKHLSFASSLCGKCTTVCPVKIPLHELLLVNRNEAVKNGYVAWNEKKGMKWATRAFKSRKMINMLPGKTKNRFARILATKSWGSRRVFPKIADKSFNEQWKENNTEK